MESIQLDLWDLYCGLSQHQGNPIQTLVGSMKSIRKLKSEVTG